MTRMNSKEAPCKLNGATFHWVLRAANAGPSAAGFGAGEVQLFVRQAEGRKALCRPGAPPRSRRSVCKARIDGPR
jgi:hypothetical protein